MLYLDWSNPWQVCDLFPIEEFWENIDTQICPQTDNQNFLQYWDKEDNEDENKEETLQIGGPVGNTLVAFQNQSDDSEDDSHSIQDEFEGQQSFYSPENDSAEEILRNFEASVAQHHQDYLEDDQVCIPENNYDSAYQNEDFVEQEDFSGSGEIFKAKKRDLKRLKKQASVIRFDSNRRNKEDVASSQVRTSQEKSLNNSSGLIIKIRSGNNIIMSEALPWGSSKRRTGSDQPWEQEEGKKNGHGCSSSTSTMSVEKQDEKARRLSHISVSSIELENNVKIFWRGIGPLQADQRREKVLNYLEKKRARKWKKRVIYT